MIWMRPGSVWAFIINNISAADSSRLVDIGLGDQEALDKSVPEAIAQGTVPVFLKDCS